MLDKDIVVSKMRERGFTVISYAVNSKSNTEYERITSINFISEAVNLKENSKRTYIPCYSCIINLQKEEFELIYAVPGSINVLRTPKCGSVLSDEHFDKICSKFEMHVRTLYRYFGN